MVILGTRHRRTRIRCVLGVVAVALIPWTAAAGETTPPRQPLRTALADVRTRELTPSGPSRATAQRSSRATQSAQSSNPALESPSFFKTRTGVVVLAAVAVGAGYALYSASHDRIKSPGKE